MKLFIECRNSCLLSMEIDPSATVLEMKRNIEKFTGISVSNQTIFFKGRILFADRDAHTLKQCNIVKNSRLRLSFSLSRHRMSKALQQREQSPAPSTSVIDVITIEDSPEKNQDSSNDDQEWSEATEGNVGVEPSRRYDNRQDWLQRESSSSTSNIFGDFSFGEDPPLSTAFFDNVQPDINQVLQPLDQSLVPSTRVQDSFGQFEDWSAMARSIFREMRDQPEQSVAQSATARHDKNQDLLFQREPYSTSNTFGEGLPLPTEHFSNIQSHWPASTTDNSNVFHTEQSTIPSNTFGDLLFREDPPLSTEHFSNVQGHWPASTTEDIFINTEQVFQPDQRSNTQTTEKSPSTTTSNTLGEGLPLPTEVFSNIQSHLPATQEQRIIDQDWPVSPVVKTQKPTRSIREVINIPDSRGSSSNKRVKHLLTVMVLSFPVKDTPARKFPLEVYPTHNVEVLRTELAKMQQRSQLVLPEGGYFFIHKTQLLDEKQSFRWNRVAEGDTIEIFPGGVTDDHRRNTRNRT